MSQILTFDRQVVGGPAKRRQRNVQVIAAAEVRHLEDDHEAVDHVVQGHLLRQPQIDLEVLCQSCERGHESRAVELRWHLETRTDSGHVLLCTVEIPGTTRAKSLLGLGTKLHYESC